MKQLLINRFRGVLLGVAVVEAQLCQSSPWVTRKTSGERASPSAGLGWWDAIASSTQQLISSSSPVMAHELPDDDGVARLVAQILPVALFYHEDIPTLVGQLGDRVPADADPSLREGVIGIGVAIALLCQEQVNAQTLISHLLSQPFWSTTALPTQLHAVQRLLTSSASLATLEQDLNQPSSPSLTTSFTTAMASAFYCWASTSDSFSLTIGRSFRLPASGLTPLIAGALSGVFNGLSGMPLPWQTPLLSDAVPTDRDKIISWADQLFTEWSGCLDSNASPLPPERTVVTAAGRLRPRPKSRL